MWVYVCVCVFAQGGLCYKSCIEGSTQYLYIYTFFYEYLNSTPYIRLPAPDICGYL